MSRKINISLTLSEINHIKSLIKQNISNGEYAGNQKHYWTRSDSILAKLTETVTIMEKKT
jgi:hypothetical protein